MFLGVLQRVYQSLGEGKTKFVECLIREAIFDLQGISTKKGQVTLIQKFIIYKRVSQQYSNKYNDRPNFEASFKKPSPRRSHTETPSCPGSAPSIT